MKKGSASGPNDELKLKKYDYLLFKTLDLDLECGCGYIYMPYQLFLQPLTASESVAVALALRGPAQS